MRGTVCNLAKQHFHMWLLILEAVDDCNCGAIGLSLRSCLVLSPSTH